jgi:hypothetical protein
MSVVGAGIHQKSIQLLNEVVPKARVIGYLVIRLIRPSMLTRRML